jgi:ornithine cyclodeaminase/alanine dehydrogenase
MEENKLLYLSKQEVASVGITMREIIDILSDAFREKGEGRVEMPPKPAIHPGGGDNFIHAMPAYVAGIESAGIKWVGGFTENMKKNLPYITGLIILNDTKTGLPLSVMDCVWLTGMRTGAATALSARYLARPDSETCGILGCGVQGRTNLEALNVLFPLKKVMAYDVSEDAAKKYAQDIGGRFGLEVIPVKKPKEAVTGCDLVVTAGLLQKKPHATIQPGWMDEGSFASMVDYDSYWHRDAIKEAAKFCTDDVPQLRLYQNLGYFQNIPDVYADLGELVTGKQPGRESENEITITANLGLALNDIAVAPLVYKLAKEKGIGTWLPL